MGLKKKAPNELGNDCLHHIEVELPTRPLLSPHRALKKAGGGKFAVRCSLVGIILGLFLFPPLGILFGAFIGAFIGASFEKGERNNIKIAFGAVWGFVLGTILKFSTSIYIIYFMFLK